MDEQIQKRYGAIKSMTDRCGIAIQDICFIAGGRTNEAYTIYGTNHKKYIARIAGEGTEKIINRPRELHNIREAARVNIAPEVYCAENGNLLIEFLDGISKKDITMLENAETLDKVTTQLRNLHTSGAEFQGRFSFLNDYNVYRADYFTVASEAPAELAQVEEEIVALITRMEETGVAYYTQIGTGNYNEKTSRLYTDLSYITARDEIGEEALQVFQALMLGETVDHMSVLLVAPHCLQDKLIDMIDGEISKAKAGQKGLIRLKMNSLTDKMLIDKLVEASQAGVQVEMIVRGICCLRGGVPGLTDNVHIISIVGRFLEHSRIYIFGDGDAARYYIASADWMTRNTLRRVEVATPILQDDVKRRIDHIFDVMWHDNVQARDQQPDGSYTRRYPGTQTPLASQNVLYDEAYRMAKGIKEQ